MANERESKNERGEKNECSLAQQEGGATANAGAESHIRKPEEHGCKAAKAVDVSSISCSRASCCCSARCVPKCVRWTTWAAVGRTGNARWECVC
jgi:hypothetical protein